MAPWGIAVSEHKSGEPGLWHFIYQRVTQTFPLMALLLLFLLLSSLTCVLEYFLAFFILKAEKESLRNRLKVDCCPELSPGLPSLSRAPPDRAGASPPDQ